jgi:hypothetical protein
MFPKSFESPSYWTYITAPGNKGSNRVSEPVTHRGNNKFESVRSELIVVLRVHERTS